MTKEKTNRNEVVGMFLTYCRKTLVNARTDVLRERKRRRNREVLFCDLRRSELESLADWQDVPERETVFDAAGKHSPEDAEFYAGVEVGVGLPGCAGKTLPRGAGNNPALLFCRMVG